jgi:acyl-CoA thioester hydrolase
MNAAIKQLSEPYHGAFVGAVHHFAVRVYFEDTDLSGIVYHANYLRFMERARSDMLRCVGVDQRRAMEAGGGYYAVHDLAITYRRPAMLDDALLVKSRVINVRAAACEIEQVIWRGDEILTQGRVTAAFLGMDGRPKRQPAEWREAFDRLAAAGE